MPEEETTLDTTSIEEWEDWEELDYKALYEKEKERADKRQSRFKSAKAQEKEKAQYEINDSYIDKKVKEELFFEKNSTASEFREEVKKIQSQYTWMDAKTAFELYLAKNKPELLKSQTSNLWVDGITKEPEPEKDWRQMTDAEFNEFCKARWKK